MLEIQKSGQNGHFIGSNKKHYLSLFFMLSFFEFCRKAPFRPKQRPVEDASVIKKRLDDELDFYMKQNDVQAD